MASHAVQEGKNVNLRAWNEIVGELRNISRDDRFIYLKINASVLSFLKDSFEAMYIQKNLDDTFVGQKIALLRTDIPEKILCIRLVD